MDKFQDDEVSNKVRNRDRYELLRRCPSLSDSRVIERNPEILDVAWFVYSMSLALGAPPLFAEIGVKNLEDYIKQVDSRTNFQARRSYQVIRDNLPWKK